MEDEKEIEKFDPSTLMDGVRDRIKATFIALIPDEAWNQIVKKEIDEWMAIRKRDYRYKEEFSDFGRLVRDELKKRAVESIQKIIGEFEEYSWDQEGRQLVNENVKKIILENADAILLSVIGSMVQGAVNNLKYSLKDLT